MTTAMPPNPTETENTLGLSPEQVRAFHEQGYLGPLRACSPEEMDGLRQYIDRHVLPTDGPAGPPHKDRHVDHRPVYDLVTRKAILDPMAAIFGENLLLWAVYLWEKGPDGKEIPWHQDANFWPIEPALNISAWIAIDPATRENSCPRLLPGSHKKVIPHVADERDTLFGERADPNCFDEKEAVEMVLEPGEFFLFTEKTLHASPPNRSTNRRLGMSMRVTLPIVRVTPLYEAHRPIVVRGHDPMGFNEHGTPPAP
jgi:ectoine hydroxylase-related dioxygenase (phytanoyl-CoA dioxygenase family)